MGIGAPLLGPSHRGEQLQQEHEPLADVLRVAELYDLGSLEARYPYHPRGHEAQDGGGAVEARPQRGFSGRFRNLRPCRKGPRVRSIYAFRSHNKRELLSWVFWGC